MTIYELLDAHSIPYERKENDNVYIDCDGCGKQNLSINVISGLWHCWNPDCEEKGYRGNFPSLAAKLNIPANQITWGKKPPKRNKPLTQKDTDTIIHSNSNKAEVIEFCVSRGLDPSYALSQGVGYDPSTRAIVFPFRNSKGVLIGAKFRGLNGDQWTKGTHPKLYIPDPSDLKKEKIVVVEAEIDALTLKQFGIPCVATLGAGKDEGLGLLGAVRQVYLGYDMDPAGEAGVDKAAEALGRYRCKRVEWTAKDPNDMIVKLKLKKEELLACLKEARDFDVELKSLNASDTLKEYNTSLTSAPKKRMSWGFPRLDSFTQGIGGGMYIGVLAEAGTGKTTFMLNAASNIALQGINVGIASLEEHPINEITPKLGATIVARNPGAGQFTQEELERASKVLSRVYLYEGEEELDELTEWIKECYYAHNVKCIFIDYLQWLVPDEKDTELLKRIGKTFKKMVKRMPDLCIVMIIQPKQANKVFDKDGKEKKTKLDGNAARGGSTINQSVDAMLTIRVVDGHPNVTQFEYTKIRGHLRVSKKDWLNQFTQLEYDHGTLRQSELTHMIYGG